MQGQTSVKFVWKWNDLNLRNAFWNVTCKMAAILFCINVLMVCVNWGHLGWGYYSVRSTSFVISEYVTFDWQPIITHVLKVVCFHDNLSAYNQTLLDELSMCDQINLVHLIHKSPLTGFVWQNWNISWSTDGYHFINFFVTRHADIWIHLVTVRHIHPPHLGHTKVTIMVMNDQLTSHSFHVNQPSNSWHKTISNSDLDESRPWSLFWSKGKGT